MVPINQEDTPLLTAFNVDSVVARTMRHNDKNRLFLVDTHVHYYPFCDFAEFFDSAWYNMRTAAADLDSQVNFTGILCLMETQVSDRFRELREAGAKKCALGRWRIHSIHEGTALVAESFDNDRLYIVPGRQIITEENLEVLIIGGSEDILHKHPLMYYFEKYSKDRLIVIPWGVGKWLGKRGRVLNQAIYQASQLEFALADNSGRPSCWRKVPQFDGARRLGKHIFAGSDPLPLAGQQKKVGTYGVAFLSNQTPENLVFCLRKTMLELTRDQIRIYGGVDGLFDFAISQFLLRLRRIKSV